MSGSTLETVTAIETSVKMPRASDVRFFDRA